MKKNKTIHFSIIIDNKEVTLFNIKSWLIDVALFKPMKMMGTYYTKGELIEFNKEKIINLIEEELLSNHCFTISLEDNNNRFIISRKTFFSRIWGTFEYNLYNPNNIKLLLNCIDSLFRKYHCVVANCCSAEDNFWQNLNDLNIFKIKSRSIENLKLKQNPLFKNKEMIDIEYNPGHSHFVRDIWFGSCWAMWFGKEFFKYIPRDILSGFRDCYENSELEDGSLRILLHENLWEYDKPEHRERQWKFRLQTGMDEVAHQLINKPIITENPDPSIEIFTGIFKHGGERLIKYYYNKHGEVATKSKSIECRTYELNDKGVTVWSEIKSLI